MSSLQGSNKLGIIPSPRPDTCGLKVGTCKPLAHVARAKKCVLHGKNVWPKRIWATHQQNPPAPKVLGRDRPDGTRKRLQVYLGGGPIIRPKPPVFDRS